MSRTNNCECEICGKRFYKRPSQIKLSNHHYCNRNCVGIARRNPKKKCHTCNKKFQPTNNRQRYCSVSCAASRSRRNRKNNSGKNKSETIKKYFIEDGWDKKCMIDCCEYDKTHDLHRVVEGIDGGEYTIENTASICPNHHAEIHRLSMKIIKIGKFRFKLEG